jgi:hypothetical protein
MSEQYPSTVQPQSINTISPPNSVVARLIIVAMSSGVMPRVIWGTV